MAGADEVKTLLRAGIAAARKGDRSEAARLFRQVIAADEDNEAAWMWLATVVRTADEKRAALEHVLEINPANQRARDTLQRLDGLQPRLRPRQEAHRPERQYRTVDSLRETERVVPVLSTEAQRNRGGVTFYLLVVLLLGIVAVIVALIVTQAGSGTDSAISSQPTRPPATATAPPPTMAATELPRRLIDAPTLPPSFTPTGTPPPSPTASPAVSPLSRYTVLYALRDENTGRSLLFRARGDGARAQRLAAGRDAFHDVAVDPSGTRIAFVSMATYSARIGGRSVTVTAPELFVAPLVDVAAAQRITTMGGDILANPGWSPDSSQLVFTSNRDGDEELWIIRANGNDLRQITVNEGIDRTPDWSADGSLIVFASDRETPGFTEIYTMTPRGRAVTRLTNEEGNSFAPVWSPDRSQIAFISDRGGDDDLYIMDADGQRPFLLTIDDGAAQDRAPRFIPDGRRIAFVSDRGANGVFQLYVIDVPSVTIQRVTDGEPGVQSAMYLS